MRDEALRQRISGTKTFHQKLAWLCAETCYDCCTQPM